MKKIVCILIMMGLSSCSTSPLGRKRVLLVGQGAMNNMGAQSFEELKKKTPIEYDPKINAYVNCIAHSITLAAKGSLDAKNWEIVVFKDATANAFALPGGKIGVHTGILPVAKTQDQLAAVLGHEVGHVIAQHGNERVSESELASLLMGVVELSTSKMDPEKKKLLMGGLGVGLQFGALLPFSRAHESEADLIGLDLMAKAGFDPFQSVELWKNMKLAAGSAPPEWASTHPSSENRINTLQSHAGEHMQDYKIAIAENRAPKCQLK